MGKIMATLAVLALTAGLAAAQGETGTVDQPAGQKNMQATPSTGAATEGHTAARDQEAAGEGAGATTAGVVIARVGVAALIGLFARRRARVDRRPPPGPGPRV